jgi:hypothetical protein
MGASDVAGIIGIRQDEMAKKKGSGILDMPALERDGGYRSVRGARRGDADPRPVSACLDAFVSTDLGARQ